MNRGNTILVAGGSGLVGGALTRRLRAQGFENLLLPTRAELDLTRQEDVSAFFARVRPSHVFLVAGRVGGIHANNAFPAEFIRENLQIEINVIDAAWRSGTEKLLFVGSSCIYPKFALQPISEDCLLAGPLEPTNEWYAIAKIAGIKMCQAYRRQYGFRAISAMPTNLYGPGDSFSLENAHVLPALIRKFHDAKVQGKTEVVVWGSGNPRREFLYVDDLADALIFLMEHYDQEDLINIGLGTDLSIAELAELVGRVVEYPGKLVFDRSKPDGTPRKLLNISKISSLGWAPRISLDEGLRATYRWFLGNLERLRM